MARDYREIQVSSSVLVFIILGIIILGAVIFFIGVQVGKKQADLILKTMVSQKAEEKVSAPVPVLPEEQTATPDTTKPAEAEPETVTKAAPATSPAATVSQASTAVKTPPTSSKPVTTSQASTGNYFIQVGAFNDRSSARLEAEKFKKQGYNAVVKEPFSKDRTPLYRVWLGGFKSRDEAHKNLNDLISRSAGNPDYFIVQQ